MSAWKTVATLPLGLELSEDMDWDVIVVGSGPAGVVVAALLARSGYRVAILARSIRRRSWAELLAPSAVRCIDRLGLSEALSAGKARPCPGIIDFADRQFPTANDFELTQCTPGWVVDRGQFDHALLHLAIMDGVSAVSSDQIWRMESMSGDSATVVDAGGNSRLSARFVVDATGSTGALIRGRESRRRWFDRRVAVRCINPAIRAIDSWMRLGWSSAGWWYLLPESNGSTQVVFMTDGDRFPRSQAEQAAHLHHQWSEAFDAPSPFGHVEDRLHLEVRDARTSCRKVQWSGRWMPVGDAAFTIDPITGSGMQRAMEMAEATANAVDHYLKSGHTDLLQQSAVDRLIRFNREWQALQALEQQLPMGAHRSLVAS